MSELLRQRGPNTPSPQANAPEGGRLRVLAIAALVAAASHACVLESDESETYGDDTIASTENAVGKGEIFCDVLEGSRQWIISGNSSEDFVLKVLEEGQVVFNESVPAGEFKFQEPIQSDTASLLPLQAFKSDTGEQIKIVDHQPGPEEMYGSTNCVDLSTYQNGQEK